MYDELLSDIKAMFEDRDGSEKELFVPVEICQSSNMYLLPPMTVAHSDTPLSRFINHSVPVVLGTDNDGVFRMCAFRCSHHTNFRVLTPTSVCWAG